MGKSWGFWGIFFFYFGESFRGSFGVFRGSFKEVFCDFLREISMSFFEFLGLFFFFRTSGDFFLFYFTEVLNFFMQFLNADFLDLWGIFCNFLEFLPVMYQ